MDKAESHFFYEFVNTYILIYFEYILAYVLWNYDMLIEQFPKMTFTLTLRGQFDHKLKMFTFYLIQRTQIYSKSCIICDFRYFEYF